MALNINLQNTPHSPNININFHRPAAKPTPQPGSLIVHDMFQPSNSEKSPHGTKVRQSALQHGFRGPVVERQRENTSLSDLVNDSLVALENKDMAPVEAKLSLTQFIERRTADLVQGRSKMLDDDRSSGTKYTAVNMSLGESKASMAHWLVSEPRKLTNSDDPAKRERGFQFLENQFRAYGIDEARFHHDDPAIRNRERKKYVQSVVDHVDQVFDNSALIAGRRKKYDEAVRNFEANHNSVVISACNEGEHKAALESMIDGSRLNVPADFERNILENEEVTSVGATRWFRNGNQLSEKRAKYSSHSDGVDIYASGSLDFQGEIEKGTSFAAPRVGAAMAELHRLNPNLSSSQIETLMKQRLTHSLNTSEGDLTVLDYGKTFEFLRNGTY